MVALCAIARKLAVAVWYAMKGYLPDILDAEAEIKRKLRKVSQELGSDYVKESMGFKTVKEFAEKYLQVILFYKHQMKVNQ